MHRARTAGLRARSLFALRTAKLVGEHPPGHRSRARSATRRRSLAAASRGRGPDHQQGRSVGGRLRINALKESRAPPRRPRCRYNSMPRSRCNRECQAAETESDRAVGRGARGRPLPRTHRVGAPTVSLSAPLVTVQPGQGRAMHRRHIGHTRTFCNSPPPPTPARRFGAPRPRRPRAPARPGGPSPSWAGARARPSRFRERRSAPQPPASRGLRRAA